MSDATIFVLIFGGLFVLRFVLATLFFLYIIPDGDRCPMCDAPTLRVEGSWLLRRLRWFRPSWCVACGWEGMLRRGPITPEFTPTQARERKAPSATGERK